MKSVVFSLILFLVSLYFIGCEKEAFHVTPSGQITSKTHVINELQEVNISDPFQAYVTFSETESALRIEANDNLHALIEVEELNGRLSIHLKDNSQITGQTVLKVYLTTNQLEVITAQGTAEVYLQNDWQIDQAEVNLTGDSHLTGTMYMNKLTADLSGASSLEIQGSAQTFDIEATGASDMTGFEFAADQLKADLTGGCELSLTVNDEMSVTASGGSEVHYRGNAVIQYQELSGGSEIIKE
ncbi:MAG: head GIN domain-containing protein [Saprospiraceae bacterium]|nr:DUF2807 domain-containing protein [Lewinella sp.]